MTKKILILSANPGDTDRLRLDKEVSKIKAGLRRAKHREQFDIHSEWAVSFDDLRRALLDYEPQIVHFSGHGDEDGLMLEGELEFAVPISAEALSELFGLCANHIDCVILNACYSARQAAAINRHINYVIGMPEKINDTAAIKFSIGFYDALGAGHTIEKAFKFGCSAIRVLKISKKFYPRLYKKKSAHFNQDSHDNIGDQNNVPPSHPTSQAPQQYSSVAPIIHAENIKNINYTPGGDIYNIETNYNNHSGPKEEKQNGYR